MAARKKAELEEEIMEQQEEETVVEKKPQKRVFNPTDPIKCHSIVDGGVYMIGSRTGILYKFSGCGDEYDIEYSDLSAAVRSRSDYVFSPYIIVDDEDFVKEFPVLKKFYDERFSVKDLRELLKLDVTPMINAIKNLPPGAFESMKPLAANAVKTGQLDSVRKIRALDELFGTDLDLISSLIVQE